MLLKSIPSEGPRPSATELAAAALRTLIDSKLPLGLAVLDGDFRFLHINGILASANGPPVAEHLGRTVREALPSAADVVEPLLREVMAGQPLRDIRIRAEVPSAPGEASEWSATYLPIPGPDGRAIGILAHAVKLTLQQRNEMLEREASGRMMRQGASSLDIGDRLAAQRELEAALREKTVLLNEIHHRVKNNLQVISSLLNLQARQAEPQVQTALRDSQSRVRSMALMHQLLYEHADFSALDLGRYLRRLAGLLRDTYLDGSSVVQLLVELPEAELRIDMERAIPFGLLVTELLTNALKHGFPQQRAAGSVWLRVTLGADALACVDVRDDGVGMPAPGSAGFRLGKGLGLRLLPILAEQCRSALEWPAAAVGTHCRFLLPLQAPEQRHG